MSEQTKIQWADSTINFWSGCTKVSAGCANCYAEGLSKRGLPAIGGWGKGAARKRHKSAVKDALAYNRKPWICNVCGEASPATMHEGKFETCMHDGQSSLHRRRIFSLSLGDWLDTEVPIEWLAEMLDTIRQCDQVTWILCSKRWENFCERVTAAAVQLMDADGKTPEWLRDWVCNNKAPANIIGLCSVENQDEAEVRIPNFLQVPLACRGLSLEPLLGPVDLTHLCADESMGCTYNALTGIGSWNKEPVGKPIDWLIIGGESGTNARPCNVDWIRSLVAQGKAAGVAPFVKQLGAMAEHLTSGSISTFGDSEPAIESMRLRDKKGGDINEWPQDLRVQEWPKGF